MRMGTNNFLSYAAAVRYYRPYFGNETPFEVNRKLREGEIKLGRPTEQPGQRTFLIDNGTRWAIEDKLLANS